MRLDQALEDIEFCSNLDAGKFFDALKLLDGATAKSKLIVMLFMENINIFSGTKVIPSDVLTGVTSISKVVLPETVKVIEDYGFYDLSGLEYVELPESLESIGDEAFFSCPFLTRVYIKSKNIKHLGKDIFRYCNMLNKVNFEGTMAEFEQTLWNKETAWRESNTLLKTIECEDGDIILP